MATVEVVTYGPGGYDTSKPNNNVISTRTVTLSVEQENEDTLRAQALTAWQGNKDFLAITSPNNAQTLAQVKALTRQNNGLIRLLLGKFDGTD